MFKISQDKKDKGQSCCAYGCKQALIKKKGGLCHKHYSRKLRELRPKEVRYSQMKQKAKSRGIQFSLTLQEFLLFCNNTKYLTPGLRGQSATVDRRCNAQGYHLFNIQLLSNRANARKGSSFSGNQFTRPEPHKTIAEELSSFEQTGEDEIPF